MMPDPGGAQKDRVARGRGWGISEVLPDSPRLPTRAERDSDDPGKIEPVVGKLEVE